MLIAVILGLACWVAAIGYLILPAVEYWQAVRQTDSRSRDERLGNQFEALLRCAAGVIFFIIGLSMMAAVLPIWKVLAIVFGSAFLGASMWAWRRTRRNWRRFSSGNHRREAILCYLAIPVFAVLGALLLYSVVKGISPAASVRSPSG